MSENDFQTALTTTFSEILEHAITHNFLICIPSSASLKNRSITRKFISNQHIVDHMLKPSPYVENIFQTMTGKNLIIKNNEIKSDTGYTHKFALQILKEENTHDINGRVYKQVFVSAPLDDTPNKSVMAVPEPVYKFYSAKEYIGFLRYAVEDSEAAYMFAQAFIVHFNHSYIIFKQFAKDTYNKVKVGLNDLKLLVLKIEQFESLDRSQKNMQYLCELVESNILYDIHEKLFAHMTEFHLEEEHKLNENCERLIYGTSANRIGFDPELEGMAFRESRELIDTLNSFRTPWEKLETLCKLSGLLDKECKKHLYKINIHKAEKWEMSADKYFPLLIYFICAVKPQHIQANLTYITEFSICPGSSGEQRYHLTNLLSAVNTITRMAEDLSVSEAQDLERNTKPDRTWNSKKSKTKDSSEQISLHEEEPKSSDRFSYGVFGPPSKRFS